MIHPIQHNLKEVIDYIVFPDGRIWSEKRKIYLKPDIKKDGYLRVTLCQHGKTSRKYIHRLVLETFVGPCPLGMQCRHLDGNRSNNEVDNLSVIPFYVHAEVHSIKQKFAKVRNLIKTKPKWKLNLLPI